ncbi:MAG: alpha/beta hydrolase [Gammaproteobacteria bacterium]|nr:MAG: alpha/beta hydrolase [Gammaproteobacteria bacterium]
MRSIGFRYQIKNLFVLLASFLPWASCAQAHEFKVYKDIVWASPKNLRLTADIYVPATGKKKYPVLVIYHGGGWLINNNSIMTSMAEYVASHGEFVVANMNYRLLPDNKNTTTMNEIVEDALGGVLWVKDHIAHYGGDPKRIAVTGDSAGGHLASMILLSGRNLNSDGFAGDTLGFKPSYLPKGKTAEQIAKKDGLKVQAAVISYGAFDLYNSALNNFEKPNNNFWSIAKAEARGMFGNSINPNDNADYYEAVSPLYNVPASSDYKLPPQFVHVGSNDNSTTPAAVTKYVEKLEQAGQPVEFKIYEGKSHAFLDSGCSDYFKTCFDKVAPDALDDIIQFLEKILK